jgi:hypothetical protein
MRVKVNSGIFFRLSVSRILEDAKYKTRRNPYLRQIEERELVVSWCRMLRLENSKKRKTYFYSQSCFFVWWWRLDQIDWLIDWLIAFFIAALNGRMGFWHLFLSEWHGDKVTGDKETGNQSQWCQIIFSNVPRKSSYFPRFFPRNFGASKLPQYFSQISLDIFEVFN